MPTTEHSIPPVISNILSNEEYPGPFEFEVDICPNGSKNPWVVRIYYYSYGKNADDLRHTNK